MFKQRKLVANGLTFKVVVRGEGPDVLLVHGFPDCHEVWRHQIPALVAAGYRVIVPDLRGCGDSDMPPRVRDYKIDSLVGDLVAILAALGANKVRLVGHDWGAVLSWQLCLRHPELVDRHVALSVGHPNAYAAGGVMQKLRGYYILLFLMRGLAEWLIKIADGAIFRLLVGGHAEFANWRKKLWRPGRLTAALNYYRANILLILKKDWPSSVVPTFGIWSSGDKFLVERQMTASERHVTAGWRYQRIERASHWLQLDAPETINSLILDYLK
jgi:pimeloyl-ACP methyl ester carboxylesterase